MSFLGVKVILFLVIPLIIKEKSNASALTPTVLHAYNGRYEHEQRPFSMFITVDVRRLSQGFRPIFSLVLPHGLLGFSPSTHGVYAIMALFVTAAPVPVPAPYQHRWALD